MPGHVTHAVVTLTSNGTTYNLGTLVAAARPSVLATATIVRLEVQPLAANTGLVYIGGTPDTSSTDYGARLEIPVSSVPQAPYLLFGDRPGPTPSIDDYYLRGSVNSDKVAVFIQLNI